jgi:hypothetical protein
MTVRVGAFPTASPLPAQCPQTEALLFMEIINGGEGQRYMVTKQGQMLTDKIGRSVLVRSCRVLKFHATIMAQPLPTVAIVSIGEMGLGIAQLLIAHKYRVITFAADRR